MIWPGGRRGELPAHHDPARGDRCPGRFVRVAPVPGEHVRGCICGRVYVAHVYVADISPRTGAEVLACRWLDHAREAVA
jgi:hypothetical protein